MVKVMFVTVRAVMDEKMWPVHSLGKSKTAAQNLLAELAEFPVIKKAAETTTSTLVTAMLTDYFSTY